MRTLWAAGIAMVVLLTGQFAQAQSGAEGALWENRHTTKHVKSDEGKVIGNGCSKCHAGLDAKMTVFSLSLDFIF